METEHELWTDVTDDEGFVGTIVAIGVDDADDPDGPYGATYKLRNIHGDKIVKAGLCSKPLSCEELVAVPFTVRVSMTVHVNIDTGEVDHIGIQLPMQIGATDFDPDAFDAERVPTLIEMRNAVEILNGSTWALESKTEYTS